MKKIQQSGLGLLFVFALAWVPSARANSINYDITGITEWDDDTDFPASATVDFMFTNNQIVVTITNTDGNTFFSSEAVSGISFTLFNGGTPVTDTALTSSVQTDTSSVSVVNPGGTGSAGGSTVSAHPLIENSTPTTTNGTLVLNQSLNWYLQNIGTAGSFGSATPAATGTGSNATIGIGTDAFILANAAGSSTYDGTNSIIGSGNASGQFTGTNNSPGPCPTGTTDDMCNSGEPIVSPTSNAVGSAYYQATQQFILDSATFTLSVPGVTSTTTVGTIFLILGPDGPDYDDFLEAPEPSAYLLGAFGILFIALFRMWRNGTFLSLAQRLRTSAVSLDPLAQMPTETRASSWQHRISSQASRIIARCMKKPPGSA